MDPSDVRDPARPRRLPPADARGNGRPRRPPDGGGPAAPRAVTGIRVGPRRAWRRLVPTRYDVAGLVVAALMAAASLTPSLLPRGPVFQGVVTAVLAVCGYALGVLLGALVRRGGRRAGRGRIGRAALAVLGAGAVAVLGVCLWRWSGWQGDVRLLADHEPPAVWSPVVVVGVAAVAFVVAVAAGRLVRAAGRVIGRPLQRLLPVSAATTVGAAVLLIVLGAAADRYAVGAALRTIDRSFDQVNDGTRAGVQQPRSALRSGGPGSASPWHELGQQGRTFVASGPDLADLSRVSGGARVNQPIRVFAGLDTDEDPDALAALAVDELRRTGAFDRAVLCVAVPTGRGWVNERAARALEYLHAGDTAIVSIQYSYLPSALEFLVDPERAKDAGRALFEAVYEVWSQMPEDRRAELVVYGESLGSTGIQAAFSGLADVRARTDGALLVGPPQSNTLWRTLVERRDPGTREVLPVYDGGATVRFAAEPADLDRPQFAWHRPRVVVVQHPSDPIVWWSPRLLVLPPDWLREQRADEVSPAVDWYPVATFLQIAADMPVATDVPIGHGHRYGDFLDYWTAVVPPEGWTPRDTLALKEAMP